MVLNTASRSGWRSVGCVKSRSMHACGTGNRVARDGAGTRRRATARAAAPPVRQGRGVMAKDLQDLGMLVAEQEFDGAILRRLKPDDWPSIGRNAVIFRWRQRLEHRPLLEELLLDQLDPRQDLEARIELDRAVHVTNRRLQLVHHQLHPQLGGLMLDDEQHLVVPRRLLRGAERGCCAESSRSSRR